MTETAKHTPGPWRVWEDGSEHWWICEPEQERRHSHFAQVSVGNMWHEEGEANARLIAAAPELLEACKMISTQAVSLGIYWKGLEPEERQALTMCRAAIAKATRDTP